MRGVLVACVVLACLVAMMVERTEGHITFFSPKEIKDMKLHSSKIQNQTTTTSPAQSGQGQKNMAARSEEGPFEESTERLLQDETVELAVRLSPRQLDQVAPVLEEIIHQIANQKAK